MAIIKQKNEELEKLSKELENSIKELKEKQETITEQANQNQELFRYAFAKQLTTEAGSVLQKFNNAATGKGKLEDEDWEELITVVNKLYPDFESKILSNVNKIDKIDLHIAYLLKVGMNNSEIEKLINKNRTTVWRRGNKLKETFGDSLFNKEDN